MDTASPPAASNTPTLTRPWHSDLWVALAEKAYAEANVIGLLSTTFEGQDSYGGLCDGWPDNALQAVTGKPASDYSINPTNIAAAWNAGQLIVLDTTTPSSS